MVAELLMSKSPKLANYVSEIDQFLLAFDQQHPEASFSQRKEIDKYRRIYHLRDTVSGKDEVNKLWEDF